MLSSTMLRRLVLIGGSATVAAFVVHRYFRHKTRHQITSVRKKSSLSAGSGSGSAQPTKLCVDPSRIWIIENSEQWNALWPVLEQEIKKFKVLSLDCEWKNWKVKGRISLLQLSTCSGLVLLVRLLLLDSFPKTLTQILEDRSIIKVGIQIQDDVKKLRADHAITVHGWMDLRNLAIKEKVISTFQGNGLRGLSKTLLGIELSKHSRVVTSDWEAETLSQQQVEYAAADALVGMFIFTRMVSLRLGDNTRDFETTIDAMCDGLVEIKVGKDTGANHQQSRSGKENSPGPSTSIKTQSRAYVPRKSPMYENCRLLAPDDQLLCTCDQKKAQWYVDKGLADPVCEDPFTVKLRFEPAGRPKSAANYYCTSKQNICVVCGSDEAYVRKNIVPHEYRKYFPSVMKEHRSHDVLLLCLRCHQTSNLYDFDIKKRLERDCDADITTKYHSDFELKQVVSAAKALQQHYSRLPIARREELESVVTKYYGVDQMDAALLQRALTINTKTPNADFVPHGEKVVQHMMATAGLVEFEKMWREHFLETMKPKHLPELWSVEYQERDVLELDSDLMSYIERGQGENGDQ